MIVTLPVKVPVTKGGKPFYVNLNQYRNAHFHTLNKAKVVFKELVQEQVKQLPFMKRIAITYTLYPATAQLCDINNVVSIVDKFFCDALVEYGRIEDDNYNIVIGTQHLFGAIDRHNPRVEARISRHD